MRIHTGFALERQCADNRRGINAGRSGQGFEQPLIELVDLLLLAVPAGRQCDFTGEHRWGVETLSAWITREKLPGRSPAVIRSMAPKDA